MTSVWSGWILNRYTFSLPIFELIVWPLSHTVYYTLRANCPQYYYNETDGTVFPATAQTRILSIKYWRTEVGDIYYPAIVCCYCSQSRLPLTIILSISISPTSTHYTVYVEEERLDFCLLFPAEQYTYNRLFSIPVSHRWVVLVPSHLRTLQQLITVLIVQKWLFLGSKAKTNPINPYSNHKHHQTCQITVNTVAVPRIRIYANAFLCLWRRGSKRIKKACFGTSTTSRRSLRQETKHPIRTPNFRSFQRQVQLTSIYTTASLIRSS